jgi:hypothetical protein
MATLDDIRMAVAEAIEQVVFPNGSSEPPIVKVSGVVKIGPGWPAPGDVSLDKLAEPPDGLGNVIIAVQDTNNQDVTRFSQNPVYLIERGVPTLVWEVSSPGGFTLTLTGEVTVPQNVAIVLNHDQDVVYGVQPQDTIENIIVALKALIPPAFQVDADANSLYFPNALSVIGRVGAFSRYVQLTGQYRATVCIALFCGDDRVRNSLVGQIKPALDLLKRITLPDGTVATLTTGREVTVTDMEGMGVESSRLIYMIEYSSALTILAPQVTVFRTSISTSGVIFPTLEA